MTAPRATIWPLESWTAAKHTILRRYLQAWFPILARYNNRLLYVDGFAGPGRYQGGEDGSPVIALAAARDHFARLQSTELTFLFVEENGARAPHLRDVEIPALHLPAHFNTQVVQARFEETLTEILDATDRRQSEPAPTFAFVDPFGITGLPFALLARLLARPRSEVLVTFMTYTVQRFVEELPDQVAALMGSQDAADLVARAEDRVATTRDIYAKALRTAARFVVFFRMHGTHDAPIYDLFFATNASRGFERMKEAMWLADASGGYTFSAGTDPNQLAFFAPRPGPVLAPMLWEQFRGRRITWEDIERYVIEETIYLPSHAREALRLMETGAPAVSRRVIVDERKLDGSKRRRGSFPSGSMVYFCEDAPTP